MLICACSRNAQDISRFCVKQRPEFAEGTTGQLVFLWQIASGHFFGSLGTYVTLSQAARRIND